MLIVRLRNMHVNWPDPVAGAQLYINPTGQVYPPVADDRNKYETTNSSGEARLYVAALLPGEHTLWIVPKHTTADPVGTATASGPDVSRIFRGLRIGFSIGNRNNVTSASVHSSTMENGKLVANTTSVKDQVFEVRLRPIWMKSPHSYPPKQAMDMIVIHKTGGEEMGTAVNTFMSSGASVHYLIGRDGHIVKFVLDSRVSGHASHENQRDQSHWGTQTNLAWRSIGIENVGTVRQGFTTVQYESLIRLVQELMRTHGIQRHRVIAHSDMLTDGQGVLSDDRIACPGHQFDWPQLESAKPPIGLARTGGGSTGIDPVADFFFRSNNGMTLVGAKPLALQEGDFDAAMVNGKHRPGRFGGRTLALGNAVDTPILHLQTWLAEIGYSVGPADGKFNRRTMRAARHFQVHFEGRSDGITVNAQTAALIRAVRDANPRAD